MGDSYNKKERAKKKRKKRLEKEQRREQKKLDGKKPVEFLYLDENGNFTETPPDPAKKKKFKAEDIVLGIPPQEKSDQSKFQSTGTVRFFNSEKGYGFIDDSQSQDSYFVHINDLEEEVQENDKVTFNIGDGPKGPVALAVRILS